jgi:polyphosphate kinase
MEGAVAKPANDAAAPAPSELAQPLYFNRELSWLAFNRRVLEEACNDAHPLLERLRFLSISGNNLDEFFMVRVAGLKAQQLLGVEERSADGLTPAQQLAAIAAEADALTASQQEVWAGLRRLLREAGVAVLSADEIGEEDRDWLARHFQDHIFPVLTPQAIDPAHPFPFIPNKGFSAIFDLKRISTASRSASCRRCPDPERQPHSRRRPHYVAIETVSSQIATLFPATSCWRRRFRIIRDSDTEIEKRS